MVFGDAGEAQPVRFVCSLMSRLVCAPRQASLRMTQQTPPTRLVWGGSGGLITPREYPPMNCAARTLHERFRVEKTLTRFVTRSGQYINFDLAYPSAAIPDDFFPSDEDFYGEFIMALPTHILSHPLIPFNSTLAGYKVSAMADADSLMCAAHAHRVGRKDFGVWNVTYQSVDCLDTWAGAKNAAALGSVDDGSSVCCPANPTVRPCPRTL